MALPALFAPSTAKRLGVEDATLVKLRVGGRELECAACVVPGQVAGSVTLHLGHGRVEGRTGVVVPLGPGVVGHLDGVVHSRGFPELSQSWTQRTNRRQFLRCAVPPAGPAIRVEKPCQLLLIRKQFGPAAGRVDQRRGEDERRFRVTSKMHFDS